MLPRWLALWMCWVAAVSGDDMALIPAGGLWRFWADNSMPGSASNRWTALEFDDVRWPSGRSGFSMGGGEYSESTLLDSVPGTFGSIFLRSRFRVADPSRIQWLTLRVDYQDGFIAYLDGQEVARRNMAGNSGSAMAFDAGAAQSHPRGVPEEIDLTPVRNGLRAGENLLAIELHSYSSSNRVFAVLPELLANFTRGPLVQNASTNAIQVIWNTPAPTEGAVDFGSTLALGQTIFDGPAITNHAVQLTGLNSGAVYFYRVRSWTRDQVVQSSAARFQTLKSAGPIRFAVLGDTGEGGASQYVLADLIAKENADFILHAGDVIYPAFTYARADLRCFSVYRSIMQSVPFYFAMGNHDLYAGDGPFLDAFYLPTNSVTGTKHFYSFESGEAHFAVLFVPYLSQYTPQIGDTQYQWLEADLANTRKPWKILLMHHPLISSALHRNDDQNHNGIRDEQEVLDVFLPLAKRQGVQVILCGHEHAYERFVPTNGVQLINTGGGGSELYSLAERDRASVHFWARFNFLRVALDREKFVMEAIGADGAVFDRLFLQRALPVNLDYRSAWHTPAWPDIPANDGDGNVIGQQFDFTGEPVPSFPGEFSNLGVLRVNNDATNLYVGLEQTTLYPDHNIFLFIGRLGANGVTSMAGLGNGVVDPLGEGVDGLDFLKNLSFTRFTPSIACLLGDEFADGNLRHFTRGALPLDIGQGVYFLEPGFPDVPGARVQQFNLSPETEIDWMEQNADFVEVAIPLAAFGNPPLRTGDPIQIGAVVGGSGFRTNQFAQARELDRSFVGRSLNGSGLGPVFLEGLTVQLASAPVLLTVDSLFPDRVRIRWQSVPGKRYQPEISATLASRLTDWRGAGLPIITRGTNAYFDWPILQGAEKGKTFFRLRIFE